MKQKTYQGELDAVNPEELGAQLFRDGKEISDETDPTEAFLMDEQHGDFLFAFYKRMEKGWYRAKQQASQDKFYALLPAFQSSLPAVGQQTYVEFPNNPGKYYLCTVEFIPPERDQVLLRQANPSSTLYAGQSALTLIGYSYPGRFPQFFDTPPNDAA